MDVEKSSKKNIKNFKKPRNKKKDIYPLGINTYSECVTWYKSTAETIKIIKAITLPTIRCNSFISLSFKKEF